MTLFPPLNYLYFFAVILGLMFIDQNLLHYAVLQVKRLELAVEKFFFLIKLRWEIFSIKRGWQDKKFEKMAADILKDYETDR